MSDSLKSLADDMKEYEALCKHFNEETIFGTIKWFDHFKILQKRLYKKSK